MKALCIYDNHIAPNVFIQNIVGQKKFADIILRRQSIRQKFMKSAGEVFAAENIIEINNEWDISSATDMLRRYATRTKIFHIFSYQLIDRPEDAVVLMEKTDFVQENYLWMNGKNAIVAFAMNDIIEYADLLKKYADVLNQQETFDRLKSFQFARTDAFFDISEYSSFLHYITGGFDARFFNSVHGDAYNIVKTSNKKNKIRAEYTFYHLLPLDMRPWFVMPFNLVEENASASYTMKRYHMPDIAIRWVHGAVSLEEFGNLMRIVFHFLDSRPQRIIPAEEGLRLEQSLYVDNVAQRIEQLKKHPDYWRLEQRIGSKDYIDNLYKRYLALLEAARVASRRTSERSVIGHGDLCFSNMLFDKDTELLKLIDPKGAMKEEELWTDPYYDVAKLSHSVCGYYDFFNNGLFHIEVDENLNLQLNIETDSGIYIRYFRDCLTAHDFFYPLVRVYEASLFLSMLPLHMDYPQKVLGFLINAERTLNDAEAELNSKRRD